MKGAWDELERRTGDSVVIDGVELRPQSRVRLKPRPGGDVFDIALAGRVAVVEQIVETTDGGVQLAVTVEDDPGRDFGEMGHRFFFSPAEVEPIARRILVAGIGNVFLGDDGFGVAVTEELARSPLPGAHVEDYGVRGMDLAYALADYDVAIFVDATPRGEAPGTLYVIEPQVDDGEPAIDTHAMDPVKVLALARTLGGRLPRVLVVGCEPATHVTGEDGEVVAELSGPVRSAVGRAARLVASLVQEIGEGKEAR